ncbi:hypothetical protein MKW92_027576 [Papaver armeniacum]|nr:hypothetical protein MKW92_027576 [Papaver armeniacum]
MTTTGDRSSTPSPESEAPAPAPVEMALPRLRPLRRRVLLAQVYFGDLTRGEIRVNTNSSSHRLEPDGNLKVHNFYTWPNGFAYWDDSYAFFGDSVEQCAFGSKCGASGSYNMETCSAFPPNGSVGCMINT